MSPGTTNPITRPGRTVAAIAMAGRAWTGGATRSPLPRSTPAEQEG